jgi:threonine dehydratase
MCICVNTTSGVALAAQKMGIKATIVMPLATPVKKKKNTLLLLRRIKITVGRKNR